MTTERTFWLWHDGERWMRHDYGLHCGDVLEAKIDGAWVQTRIEHSSFSLHSYGWFLVTHPSLRLHDLLVRKAQL